jgi:hypothetical protein
VATNSYCTETGPHYGSWTVNFCPSQNNTSSVTPNSLCAEIGQPPTVPTVTPPTYGPGEKQRTISYDCPTTNATSQTGSISYAVSGVFWDPPLPSIVTNSFSSTAYVNVSSSDSNLCAGGKITFGMATWTVSCNFSHYTTNCSPGGVFLTNITITTNVCLGSPVMASVTPTLTNAIQIITSNYTNACGNADTNCPATKITNSIPPTLKSNWWVVSGPGSFAASGTGTSATFTPTNTGSGTVTFHAKYTSGCNTNELTATPGSRAFNVIRMTNVTVSPIPTNTWRLDLGVGEVVNLSLVGTPAGSVHWTTTAGSLNPTNGTATAFTAPSNAAGATVTATFSGGSCDKTFNVVEPAGVSGFIRSTNTAIAVGTMGVGMFITVTVTPTNVSFYRVRMMEVGRNATNVTGYFTNAATPAWNHDTAHGADVWFQLGNDNTWPHSESGGLTYYDHAATWGYPAPWTAGAFGFHVPAKWQVGSGGPTNDLAASWVQSFTLQANGTTTVTKFGLSATRGTNGVYTIP